MLDDESDETDDDKSSDDFDDEYKDLSVKVSKLIMKNLKSVNITIDNIDVTFNMNGDTIQYYPFDNSHIGKSIFK